MQVVCRSAWVGPVYRNRTFTACDRFRGHDTKVFSSAARRPHSAELCSFAELNRESETIDRKFKKKQAADQKVVQTLFSCTNKGLVIPIPRK